MNTGHYKDQLSAFVDQELSKEDRQTVAEHLMQCDSCRREHDRIRLGAGLAASLEKTDAPETVWRSIENELSGPRSPTLETFARPRWFDLRHAGALATAILVVGFLSFLVYRGLFSSGEITVTQNQPTTSSEQPTTEIPVVIPVQEANSTAVNSNIQTVPSNSGPLTPTTGEYWPVETIAGKAGAEKLAVGEYLETDASSRVRIDVADIGNVEIAPNSRVKLVGTNDKQHRLSLERGSLHARISAPPRLFIVDTPSGKAIDLGCEYTLDVDKAGNSKLNVLSGFVALENGSRESIVPAGASCMTVKGKGLGTPFSSVATPEFERALYRFDFAGGGAKAVKEIVDGAEQYDIVTLWHLLSRVAPKDRAAVYNSLAKFVPPPNGVLREAVIRLDKPCLELWRGAVESVWAKY